MLVAMTRGALGPLLGAAFNRQKRVFTLAGLSLALAAGAYGMTGKTFLPVMDEGSIIVQLSKLPSISLNHSVEGGADGEVAFAITDNAATTRIVYHGDLPDLFREGQGVVAQGVFAEGNTVNAKEVLAKHDEKYTPPEVKEAMKENHTRPAEAYSSTKREGNAS